MFLLTHFHAGIQTLQISLYSLQCFPARFCPPALQNANHALADDRMRILRRKEKTCLSGNISLRFRNSRPPFLFHGRFCVSSDRQSARCQREKQKSRSEEKKIRAVRLTACQKIHSRRQPYETDKRYCGYQNHAALRHLIDRSFPSDRCRKPLIYLRLFLKVCLIASDAVDLMLNFFRDIRLSLSLLKCRCSLSLLRHGRNLGMILCNPFQNDIDILLHLKIALLFAPVLQDNNKVRNRTECTLSGKSAAAHGDPFKYATYFRIDDIISSG